MTEKNVIRGVITISIASASFHSASAQTRDELVGQLNQAKKEYYEKKQVIDDKTSELGRQWHMYQLQMYENIKANPNRAQAIRAELWEGAKKLSQDKRALYEQLTPLRKQWYQARLKLETQIVELEHKRPQRRK